MTEREIIEMRMNLFMAQRTVCELSIEIGRRDLAALDAAAAKVAPPQTADRSEA